MSEQAIESVSVDDVRELLNEHGVIETYAGTFGSVIKCRTCGEITGATALDALRRHDLDVLKRHGLLDLYRR